MIDIPLESCYQKYKLNRSQPASAPPSLYSTVAPPINDTRAGSLDAAKATVARADIHTFLPIIERATSRHHPRKYFQTRKDSSYSKVSRTLLYTSKFQHNCPGPAIGKKVQYSIGSVCLQASKLLWGRLGAPWGRPSSGPLGSRIPHGPREARENQWHRLVTANPRHS